MTEQQPTKKILNTRELCEYLGTSRWSVARWVASGELKCIILSKRERRYRLADVERFLSRREKKIKGVRSHDQEGT